MATLSSVLFMPGATAGTTHLASIIERLGTRVAPALGAFQVLVIER